MVLPAGRPRASGSTTYAGSSSVSAPQTVGQPRAHHREAVEAEARVLLKRRGRVVGAVGHHRANHRQFVRDLRQVREQVRDPQPALAAPLKRPVALPQQADLTEERLRRLRGGEFLAVELRQRRLVIERIDVATCRRTGRCGSPASLSPGGVAAGRSPRREARRRTPGRPASAAWSAQRRPARPTRRTIRGDRAGVDRGAWKATPIGVRVVQSTCTNSLLLNITRQNAVNPCRSTNGVTRASSLASGARP